MIARRAGRGGLPGLDDVIQCLDERTGIMPLQRFPARRRDGFRKVGPGFVEQGVGRGRRR